MCIRDSAQGVRHAEIFFDPQAHIERGVPMATVIDGLWSVLAASEERYGISTRLIMCFLRAVSYTHLDVYKRQDC